VSEGFRGTNGRLSSARLWRTVIEAARVPRDAVEGFAEVQRATPYGFVLR